MAEALEVVSTAAPEAATQDPERVVIRMQNHAMIEAPLYDANPRVKNWCALIWADARMPGGLGRDFLPQGRGDYRYMVRSSVVGEALEFAADAVGSSGHVTRSRWYGVVIAYEATKMELEAYDTGPLAILRSNEVKAQQVRENAKRWEAEQAVLQARIEERRRLRASKPIKPSELHRRKALLLGKIERLELELKDARTRLLRLEEALALEEATPVAAALPAQGSASSEEGMRAT